MPSLNLPPLAAVYVQWTFFRAIFHRGWWLVTSLYLVVEADLTPLQLVFLGTAQGLTVLVFEIPTGIVADFWSRKWSIVIAHILMGCGMLATGLTTDFPLLVLTQMLWGLSWTFLSGADVAWLTDELDQPDRIGGILGAAARWGQWGAFVGLIAFGAIAWATDLSTAIVVAGTSMLMLGVYVIRAFSEARFVSRPRNRLSTMSTILRRGFRTARSDRSIMIILLVTFLVNGADEAFSRLIAKQLIAVGLPPVPDPIVWLTLLGLVALATGAMTLRLVEDHLNNQLALTRFYLAGCLLGASGIFLFAIAPDPLVAMAGVVVVHGIAWNVVRVVGIIWINHRSEAGVRATMQSFLSQAENLGEVVLGFGLGAVAQLAGISSAMLAASVVAMLAGILVAARLRER